MKYTAHGILVIVHESLLCLMESWVRPERGVMPVSIQVKSHQRTSVIHEKHRFITNTHSLPKLNMERVLE
jgi:hypothetical protein